MLINFPLLLFHRLIIFDKSYGLWVNSDLRLLYYNLLLLLLLLRKSIVKFFDPGVRVGQTMVQVLVFFLETSDHMASCIMLVQSM